MATDFFDRQDIARRNTTRLVILFVLAVLAIMASVDLLLAATMGYLARDSETGAIDWARAADPQLLGLAVVGTLILVGGGSLFKTAQLRGGGRIVAEQLGGRRLNPLDVRVRLPLIEIALPALRALTPAQYQCFKQNVGDLVQADDHIDLFEWSLQRILLRDLETHYGTVTPRRVRYRTLASLQPQCEVLLSMLAHAGQRDVGAAQKAFERAWKTLELPQARLRPADACGLDALDAALAAFEEAAPRVKRQILQGAVTCITADRTVTATEAELLRAVSASLGYPMPPLLLQ